MTIPTYSILLMAAPGRWYLLASAIAGAAMAVSNSGKGQGPWRGTRILRSQFVWPWLPGRWVTVLR